MWWVFLKEQLSHLGGRLSTDQFFTCLYKFVSAGPAPDFVCEHLVHLVFKCASDAM